MLCFKREGEKTRMLSHGIIREGALDQILFMPLILTKGREVRAVKMHAWPFVVMLGEDPPFPL